MNAFKQFFVMIIAIIVFTITAIVGLFYTLIKHIKNGDYKPNKQLAPLFRGVALAFDGMANSTAGEMFNDLLLKEKTVKYGKWNETISFITGKNWSMKYLNERGRKFRKLLDRVLGKDHCINATR